MEGRLYLHGKGIFFEYKRTSRDFNNELLDDEPWHIKENWFVFVALSPHLWTTENFYYDGHTAESFTILGLEFGKGYSHDSRPVQDWKEEQVL